MPRTVLKTEKLSQGSLGTFAGVFTPSILTILGIILFLRLGFVVGNAGLGQALVIILLANTISVLTTFSLAAIATNFRVKGGGDYYLISRTIGLEYGGAIGVVLFLAQAISIGFYCLGFGEVAAGLLTLPGKQWPQFIGASAAAVLFIFAWLGADWATRFQYLVMAVLVMALFSFFVGGLDRWDPALFPQNWYPSRESPGFWLLFAIFFPAVTGFTQGVSMSGDLRDPGRSLPLGTFAAVILSILVYLGAAVILAFSLPRSQLISDFSAMEKVASFDYLVSAGVIAATLSSAMASFLGSARILQSLARDRVFPFLAVFAQGTGPDNNPRRAVLLAGGIAGLTIEIGNLNLVAPVVTMFFLVSYGLLNYATYYEARAASPSFRPLFKWYSSTLSLIGFLACIGAVLAIDWKAGGIALFILWILHQYLYKTSGPSRWADSHRSHNLRKLRETLLQLTEDPEHPRDWRPQIMVFSNVPERREPLVNFSRWISGDIGILTVVHLIQGRGAVGFKKKEEVEQQLSLEISKHDWPAFPLGLAVTDGDAGFDVLTQSFGVGPLKANTLVMDFRALMEKVSDDGIEISHFRGIRLALRRNYNVVLLHYDLKGWKRLMSLAPRQRRIDVWCQQERDEQLMLILAYLTTRTELWRQAEIRVIKSVSTGESEQAAGDLRNRLEEFRIEAESRIVEEAGESDLIKLMSDAALIFMPFHTKGEVLLHPFGGDAAELVKRLPVTALVAGGQAIDLDAEPDEGIAAEIALALDSLHEARKNLAELEEEAEQAAETAQSALRRFIETRSVEADREKLKALDNEAHRARHEMVNLTRKAGKAEYRVEQMKKELRMLEEKYPGLVPEGEEY